MECIAALHCNKREINDHIRLLFSERKLLDEPVEKIVTGNMFYDETGEQVRTKKDFEAAEDNYRKCLEQI